MEVNNWRQLRISTTHSEGETYCDNNIVTSRYTILTFLPKVLYEQFRRIANFFFLSLIILQLSLEVPTDPSAYIIAFALVIVVNSIKQGYEDWLRHKADQTVNQKEVHVIHSSRNLKKEKSRVLRVGQIIRLGQNDAVPADILLLSCVDSSGNGISKCEIVTANLDGEPNRKLRFCPSSLPRMTSCEEIDSFLNSTSLSIEYDEPNADLYKLNGILLRPNEKAIEITMENILLRGTTLKNVQYVFGCIIYSGKDTRLSLNSSANKRNKFSVLDNATNKLVYLMFAILAVLCSIATGLFFTWQKNSTLLSEAWYIPIDEASEVWQCVITFMLYLILLSYLIPISLSVSTEIQKFGCSKFFEWDEDMKCDKRGIGAVCNTSDLNEELGQINYLLTDKTGTLTENNLKFASASIGGIIYDLAELDEASSPKKAEFLEALALCHTVQLIAQEDDSFKYQGASPDEEVLVSTAHALGVKYLGEDDGWMSIETATNRKRFRRHQLLEFDSDRKAMSILVEDEEGAFFLISKGAESSLLPKCEKNSFAEMLKKSEEHVNQFASKGFRTLVVGKKEIKSEDLSDIIQRIETLRRKPEELQSFYAQLESDLEILGVTAVEDELQENVQRTLTSLKAAGIRIWMLTGDKMETAINIGISCSLVTSLADIIIIGNIGDSLTKLVNELEVIERKMHSGNQVTLVIDGATFAIGFLECPDFLAKITMTASQVIFCRMAPLQKAQVVKLIKSTQEGKESRVCAVGDGGNDVAMIQEAHIGIGIIGREGRQAARSADFAVPNFQCLQKAILVHGFWYYTRAATLILYFYYRGILFVLPQFFLGIESGFSGQSIYHSSYMMLYSIIFSSVPIVVYGLSEQSKSPTQLLSHPSLYSKNTNNALMNWKSGGIWWVCILIWHSFLIYYIPRLIWTELDVMDWGMFSHFIGGVVVAVTDITVVSGTVYFTWITLIGQVFSYGAVLIFYTLSSELLKGVGGGELKFVYFPLLSQVHFWSVLILICVLAIIPDLISGGIRRLHFIQERNSGRRGGKGI